MKRDCQNVNNCEGGWWECGVLACFSLLLCLILSVIKLKFCLMLQKRKQLCISVYNYERNPIQSCFNKRRDLTGCVSDQRATAGITSGPSLSRFFSVPFGALTSLADTNLSRTRELPMVSRSIFLGFVIQWDKRSLSLTGIWKVPGALIGLV